MSSSFRVRVRVRVRFRIRVRVWVWVKGVIALLELLHAPLLMSG